MPLEALHDLIPAYAVDISRNLETVLEESHLTEQQKWGCVLASAHGLGVAPVVRAVEAEAAGRLSPEAISAAKSAAAIMGMNNVYFRALHIMTNPEYAGLPARLRMSVNRNPGVERIDYELWALAVSAVNGCGACLDAHEKTLRDHAVPAVGIQAALRIGAVIHAVSRIVASETALAG
ncbi:carboxymuconolactone decarboxylase family protein [Brevundimonas sp. FT23042]|uniref:carboxymuconolactone decarboxylase family protein n=1 Tax=Brevundimonas sp. FT23042 TaxID=3393749 RepID=UPI003B589FB1